MAASSSGGEHLCVVALGQLGDEGVRVGGGGGGLDLLVGGTLLAERDVLADARREQRRLLRHEAHLHTRRASPFLPLCVPSAVPRRAARCRRHDVCPSHHIPWLCDSTRQCMLLANGETPQGQQGTQAGQEAVQSSSHVCPRERSQHWQRALRESGGTSIAHEQ